MESATPLVFEITANDQRGLIGRNTITLNVIRQEDMPANILPQARAGVDHVSTNHKYIIVDGSGSTDPDGEIVSYSWEVIDTPDSISYTPSFRGDSRYPTNHTVSTNAPGVYTIRLTVTDDRGGVSTDDVVITLEPSIVVGTVPSANTGYDRSTSPYYFNLGDSQSLTGSASTDSDGYIASYYWQQISGPKIDIANPTSVNTSFTPQFIQEYVRYRFLLTVTDDQGNQHNDEMNWYIRYTNSLPRPSLVQRDLIGLSGATLQLDGSGSYDDDNYIQTFNWTQTTGLDVVFLDYSAEPLIQLPELDPANGLARVKIGLTVTDLDGAESVIIDEENFWALHPDYQAGTIYAGADLIVQSGDQVELLGESLEPECNPISGCVDYSDHMSWIQLDGPGVINPVSSGWSYSFVAPDVLERTTLILAMAKVVTQGLFGRIVLDADPIEIIVLPAGEGLTSNAGSDQSLPEFSQTVLDGSSSTDPHGFITRYEWMQISGPDALISDSNSSITDVLLPTVSVESILDFQLTVTNDIGLQAIDMVTIIVQPDYNDGDYDGDGIPDTHDSFPDNHNEAYDFDSDGLSDSEDVDKDGDGINNDVDFYPNDPSLQSPPEITILSPINNSDVENSYVIVRGTLNAPPNTGVTVNDIVAEIAGDPYGSEFSARVPLEMGVNELVITVTPVSHKQVTQTLSVNRTGDIPFRLFVSHRNGIDEIVNRLNIVNKGSDSILQIDVDYEGNGSVDEVLLDNFEMDINHTYSIEGIYYPQVVVTDANGNQYTLTQLVNVVSTERINQLLQEQWAAMNIALAGMNHGLATDYLIEYERDAYGEMFYLLLPQFPGIISSYSALQPITLTYKYASYLINRDVDGIDRAFVVTNLRDVYGVWRLAGL